MPTYIKPKLISLESNSLIEIFGPSNTDGYLNVGAARRAELSGQKQIVICKIISEKQNEVVKLG